LALLVTQHVSKRHPNARLKWRRHMKKSFAAYTAAVAFIALAVFVPTNASAQVNIYVGPGGYAHYGY
jgi:hypothetical protein